MTKLADLLRARLAADPRALIGALNIQHDRILLNFGAIGDLPRVVLRIEGNAVIVAHPEIALDDGDLGAKLAAAEAEIATLKHTVDLLTAPQAAQAPVVSQEEPAAATTPADTDEGSGGASGGAEQPQPIDPDAYKLAELRAMAAEAGIAHPAGATKKQIADALNAAAAAK